MSRCLTFLDDADALLSGRGDKTWPRAAAFLIRLALEACLADYWSRTAPGLERCDTHAQIVCLKGYRDPGTARLAARCWAALSRACHYHGYELSPTAAELRGLHTEVRALAGRLW
ncbi:hypothetical protein AB0O28_10065 [Microbispora sp. NPDC088329]|uniref:hypothetical protein n=1 Tax=Microbispora sp. NPDC088329 TaxID=3154869 RepID=UPI00344AF5F8